MAGRTTARPSRPPASTGARGGLRAHRALGDPKGRRLSHDEAATLLAAYGIDVWGKEEANTADEAVAAAERVDSA